VPEQLRPASSNKPQYGKHHKPRDWVRSRSPLLPHSYILTYLDSYYEAWSPVESGCAKRDVSYIQEIAGSMSHLYVAFGSITPGTFEVKMMDKVPMSVVTQIMNLKQNAPGLRIYLSLGGWDFSDNGTDTQPVWGDLSSTNDKRQKFIANLEKFMLTWGFDGVDLDWE
jgi:chitinase